jgi:hypothetical protein
MGVASLFAGVAAVSSAHANEKELVRYESTVQVGAIADDRVWTLDLHYKKVIPFESGLGLVAVHFTTLDDNGAVSKRSFVGYSYSRLYQDYPWCWRMKDGYLWMVEANELLGIGQLSFCLKRLDLRELIEGKESAHDLVRVSHFLGAFCDDGRDG